MGHVKSPPGELQVRIGAVVAFNVAILLVSLLALRGRIPATHHRAKASQLYSARPAVLALPLFALALYSLPALAYCLLLLGVLPRMSERELPRATAIAGWATAMSSLAGQLVSGACGAGVLNDHPLAMTKYHACGHCAKWPASCPRTLPTLPGGGWWLGDFRRLANLSGSQCYPPMSYTMPVGFALTASLMIPSVVSFSRQCFAADWCSGGKRLWTVLWTVLALGAPLWLCMVTLAAPYCYDGDFHITASYGVFLCSCFAGLVGAPLYLWEAKAQREAGLGGPNSRQRLLMCVASFGCVLFGVVYALVYTVQCENKKDLTTSCAVFKSYYEHAGEFLMCFAVQSWMYSLHWLVGRQQDLGELETQLVVAGSGSPSSSEA